MPSDDITLPVDKRPLNVRSTDNELIAREVSNFEESPFELDGRRFQSVEAFYIWLKFFGDDENQTRAMTLYGPEAKSFGRQATATSTEYDGKEIVLGSDGHHQLVKRAIRAKLEQYPDMARRFAATYPRPIVHDFGVPEQFSRFPAAVFTSILTDLRQDLVDDVLLTKDGPISELTAKAAAFEKRQSRLPISELLLTLEGRPSLVAHPIKRYAEALADSGIVVSSYLGAGADHMAFVTPANQVLKVTTSLFPPQFTPSQFHLHIFDVQMIDAGYGLKLQLYMQPLGNRPQRADLGSFNALLKRLGWVLVDGGLDQLSVYNGGVKLHDPFAVQRLPEKRN